MVDISERALAQLGPEKLEKLLQMIRDADIAALRARIAEYRRRERRMQQRLDLT